jgi:hypothetical protein
MERVTLITVASTFCLRSDTHPERCVLIIQPDLSVPPEGWKERSETVTILTPAGDKFETTAQISLSHINIRMEDRHHSTIDQRWRVTVSIQSLTSDAVPEGSKVLVSPEIRDALLPTTLSS